jgi:hypothetical protein
MKLSAPTALIFILSLILVAVGLLGKFQPGLLTALPPEVVGYHFEFLLAGFGVLTAGVLFKGL